MAEIFNLDPIDANNTGRFPENMQFRNVNDGGRALEGLLARWFKDTAGTLTASGPSNAYAVTANRTLSSYALGLLIAFVANHTNTGAATLNVSGLGAKTIVRPDGSTLLPGDIVNGATWFVIYLPSPVDKFQLLNTPGAAAPISIPVGTVLPWPTENIPTGTLLADGSAVSRITYAALFAAYGTRYGAGDGSTTFNLPNYKDYFLRGFDASGTDAGSRTDRGDGTTGANVGTKQANQLQATTPAGTVSRPNVTVTNGANLIVGGASSAPGGGNHAGISLTTVTAALAADPVFTGTGFGGSETRPKNITVNFIIVATPAAALPTSGIGKVETTFGAGQMTSRATNGAGTATRDSGNTDITEPVMDFDASSDEFAQFTWFPPKRWDRGTVTVRIYWTTDAGLAAETVRFTIAGVAISNDDPTNATFGTAVNITDTFILQGDQHTTDESGAITIGGTPATGDKVVFQLSRDVSEDDLTGDARVFAVKLFWTSNAVSDD
jgi:microcystin-dependent protein